MRLAGPRCGPVQQHATASLLQRVRHLVSRQPEQPTLISLPRTTRPVLTGWSWWRVEVRWRGSMTLCCLLRGRSMAGWDEPARWSRLHHADGSAARSEMGAMVVRQCYVDLYDDLAKQLRDRPRSGPHHGMILRGNPGIGKSCLLNYILLRLLLDECTVYLEREDGKPRGLLFKDGRATWHEEMPNRVAAERTAVHLFDPGKQGRGTSPRAPYCVVTASPRRAHYEQIEAKIDAYGWPTVYWWMPCWEWSEMELLVGDGEWKGLNIEQVRELYRWHGGVPRSFMLLKDTQAAEKRVRDAVGQSLRSLLVSLVNMSAPAREGSGVYALLQFNVAGYAPFRGEEGERPDYQLMEVEFLSPGAHDMLGVHIRQARGDELWTLYRFIRTEHRRGGGALAGAVYEGFCHDEMPRWAAVSGVLRWPARLERLPTEVLPALDRLSSIQEGVYYRGSATYAGIDALVVCGERWYAFQYTVRNRHSLHIGVLWQMLQAQPHRRGKWLRLVLVSNIGADEYQLGSYVDGEHLREVRAKVQLQFLRFHDEAETPVANPLRDLAWR